jgi:autotransporter translocation and assembly factor TamB
MPSALPRSGSPRQSRIGRALRWLPIGLVLLVLTPLVVVQLLLLAPRPRDWAKQQILTAVRPAFGEGRLEIDDLEALSLVHVRLRGARVLGKHGERLASIDRVDALINPLTLWRQRLTITSLRATRPFVDFGAPWNEGGGFLELFQSAEAPEPESEPTPGEGGGFEIAFDDLKIDQGSVDLRIADAHFRVQDLNAALRLHIGPELALGVAGLAASVLRNERSVATLQGSDVNYAGAGSLHARVGVVAGTTTLSAMLELGSPDATGAQPVRAELHAHALSPQTLLAFGVDDGGLLTAPIDIQARANGSLPASRGALDWNVQLDTPGGQVQADGRWQAPQLSATLRVQRLDPARFLDTGVAALSGLARVELRHDAASKVSAVKLELADSSYADTPLPKLEAELRRGTAGALWLDSLRLRYPDAGLDAKGRMGSNGELALEAELNARSLAALPPVKQLGLALDGDLRGDLALTRSASGSFTAKAALVSTRTRVDDLHADALQLQLDARGPSFDRPTGRLELHTTRLRNSRMELPRAELSLSGGPAHYTLAGRFGDRGDLQAELTRVGRGLRATGHAALVIDHAGARHPLRTTIGTIEYEPDRAIAMRDVQLSYRRARATFDGRLDAKRKSRVDARVEIPDVAELTGPWMADPIAGSLRVSAALSDSIEKPKMQVEARYRSPAFQGLQNLAVDLRARADVARRQVELHVDTSSHAGAISVDLKTQLRAPNLTSAAFMQGSHELDIDIDHFVPSELVSWPRGAALPTRADVSGALRAEGRFGELVISTDLRAGLRFAGEPDPFELRLFGQYAKHKLELSLDSRDPRGPLLHARAAAVVRREQLSDPGGFLLELARTGVWEASATLHPRRLDRFPLARALDLPEAVAPAVVSAQLDIEHEPGQEPAGKLTMHAGWEGPGEQIAKKPPPKSRSTTAPPCGAGAFPEFDFDASIEKGALQSRLVTKIAGKEALVTKLDSESFMDEWLGVPRDAIRPVEAAVTFNDLTLSQLPVVCDFASGNVSGHARVSRALGQQVTARIDIRGRAISLGQAPAFDAVIGASANRQVLDANVNLKARDGFAKISAQLPLDGSGELPNLKLDGPARLEAQVRKMDVRSLLAGLPQLRATEGRADADLTFTGSLRDPDLRGTIVLHDVTMTIAELGQRLERTSATLALEGRSLSFKQLKIHDRDGSLDLSGRLTMRDWGSFKGEVQAKADDFPLRKTAAMLARLNGDARLTADIDPKRVELDLVLQRMRIELMDEDASGVQPLARNPGIVFTDSRQRRDLERPPSSAQSTPLTLKVHTSAPFSISRSDFSVLVAMQIELEALQNDVSLTGTVDLQRGYVQLLGQFFDIEQGHFEFTGGHGFEPTLELVASRKLSDGTKVGIRASGTLRAPKITFTVDDEAVTAGEALSAASGSDYGGSDATVEQQVSSVASGLAASILQLGARPEPGGLMPTLSIGASEHGPTLRAGLEADQFIPGFLEDIVIDAYVEGIFSRENGDGSHGQTSSTSGSAALLELRFPHSLVSEAQYGPSKRWSVDFSWQP